MSGEVFGPSRLRFFKILNIEGWQANAKAQEALDHLASSCQVEKRFHSWVSNHEALP